MHSRVLLHKIKFWIAASVVFFSITMGLENKIQMLHLQNHSNGKFDEEGTLKRSFVSTILLHQSRMRLAKSKAKITLLKHLHFFKNIGSGFLFGWFAFWYFPMSAMPVQRVEILLPSSMKTNLILFSDQEDSEEGTGLYIVIVKFYQELTNRSRVLGKKKTTVIIFLLLSLFQKS